jgi:hypothetical protein
LEDKKMKDGDLIESVVFPNGEEILKSNEKRILVYSQEYNGDHDECWIIEKDKTGREIARFNTRFIESIKMKLIC